ncbi:cyclic peptide export ABC transporter [Burkholderia gladioli]|uniref:cyclic peptide export ABC transporter n=1 Tax=Burkholderia gladioli TaxID=28095 RepID=UPI001641ED95|nr:cyclic peptide export ABC transporter [Burkholderia gladioli]
MLTYLFRYSLVPVILAIVAGLIGGAASSGLAIVTGRVVSGAAAPLGYGLVFLALCLVAVAARCFSEITLMRLSQDATCRLRRDLSRQLMDTPLMKLGELGESEVVVIATSDVGRFINALQTLPTLFCNIIVMISSISYMAWVSWRLAAMLSCVIVLGVYLYQRVERRPLEDMTEYRKLLGANYRNFKTIINANKELKLNHERAEAFLANDVEDLTQRARSLYVRGMTGYSWLHNASDMAFYLMIGAALFIVPLLSTEPRANLASVAIVMLSLVGPVSELVYAIPTLRQSSISMRKIEQLTSQLIGEKPAAAPPPDEAPTNPFATHAPLRLELEAIAFHYPAVGDSDRFGVGPIDLAVRAGEILLISGGNGGGKTTLAMLLLGLYPPDQGRIVLNGVSVTEHNIAAYRQHFSAIFTDFHLFDWLPGRIGTEALARVERYLVELGLEGKVRFVGGRFSTVDLSSGERKRLALLAAYMEDRPVCFFDEWAANQDPRFKEVFYRRLLPELRAQGKAIVAISHDDAYFDCADQIVRIDDGRLRVIGGRAPQAGAPGAGANDRAPSA